MPNRRIFYACQAVGIGTPTGSSYTALHGVQSVGINTSFNLEQVFEIGMISIYENIENIPDVEVTLEKVLDGNPLIYTLATQESSGTNLASKATARCSIALSIYDDTNAAATGTPTNTCSITGAVVSQVSYKIAVEGNATETVSLVANNKTWSSTWTPNFPNNSGVETPASASGITRRQHFLVSSSTLPADIPNGSKYQSISVSANIARESILELGSKAPYFRYAKFPVEVTSDFEVIAQNGDLISVSESQNNLQNRSIILAFYGGPTINLGSKNKLKSANYQGGGTDGGNATVTYSYQTFNDFTVTP